MAVHAQTTTSEVQAPMFALRHALHALILTFRVKGVDVAGDNAGIPCRTERAGPAVGAQKFGEGHRGQVERERVQKARVGFFGQQVISQEEIHGGVVAEGRGVGDLNAVREVIEG